MGIYYGKINWNQTIIKGYQIFHKIVAEFKIYSNLLLYFLKYSLCHK